MDDTAKLLVMILLISFATERITAAASFLLGALPYLRRTQSATARRRRRSGVQKILLLALGGAFTAAVVYYADIRVLRLIDKNVLPRLDFALTWLVVFAGADRAREMLQGVKPSAPAPAPRAPEYVLKIDRANG